MQKDIYSAIPRGSRSEGSSQETLRASGWLFKERHIPRHAPNACHSDALFEAGPRRNRGVVSPARSWNAAIPHEDSLEAPSG